MARRWTAVLLLFGLVARPVIAAEPELPVVTIVLTRSQEAQADTLINALRSQMSDLEATLRIERVESLHDSLELKVDLAKQIGLETGATAVIWLDFAGESRAFLNLLEPAGDRIATREIRETDPGGRNEALAVIARMSVAELLRKGPASRAPAHEGEGQGNEEPEPQPEPAIPKALPEQVQPPTDTEPPPAQGDERVFGGHLVEQRIAYAFLAYSGEQWWVSGLDLQLGIGIHRSWTLFAGYTFFQRIDGGSDQVEIHLSRHPMRIGARWSFGIARIELGVSASVLLDYAAFHVVSPFQQTEDGADWLVGGLAMAELKVHVAGFFALSAALGAEIAFNPVHYGYEEGDERIVLLDSFRVAPWAVVGIALGFG